ncbi:uncharacterized protein LOC143181570 [Calliopsis andreniformis]|uniref:uncharacterized protein LOC143181570 n=1 Tax=Calliopsis andreniformis TaxID=337506 RepID=UPI003FCE1113
MDIATTAEKDDNINKIQIILSMLKKQIDQYGFREDNTKSKTDLMRGQRIKKLTMEAKDLLNQYHKIKKEIHHYEKKLEKTLKKTVKHMKIQVVEDQMKLESLKEQYTEATHQADAEKGGPKKKTRLYLKSGNNNRITRLRPRPMFMQRMTSHNKKIKIKIKTNKKLGRREITFVNDDQQSITKLVKNVEPTKALNTRECKITLQKLTEEQTRRYIGQKQKRMVKTRRKQKQTSNESSQRANRKQSRQEPNWHIKIPRSVLEESQKESSSSELNVSSIMEDTTK